MENAYHICKLCSLFCNTANPSNVPSVSNVEKRERTLLLTVVSTTWRNSFHSLQIDFGSRLENSRLERRDNLRKRQAAPTSITPTGASPSVAFPPAPTSSPTATSIVDANIAKSWIDTAILPPSFPGADLVVPDLPGGLTVKCKNCTLQGNLDLSHGLLDMSDPSSNSENDSRSDIAVQDIIDFAENGYVELVVNNFAAHIELESTVQPSKSLVTYVAPFPDIGIPGWVIPNIAEVGPVLRPTITFGVQLSTELDFTYGFDLTVPNNSTVRLDIKNPTTNSNVTGFQDTTFSAIPFQAQVNSINLTVTAAFNPQLLLTISVLDHDGEISAGAFLNLPSLSATISQVDHVDDKCNPTNSSDKVKDFIHNSLTNIVPTVDFDVGVLVDTKLDISNIYSAEAAAFTTAVSTSYPLPTACISYDSAHKTYGPAAAAKTLGVSAASLRFYNPLTSFFSHLGGMMAMGTIFWVFVVV